MAMNGYSTFPQTPRLELHHRTLVGGVLFLFRVGVFYGPSRLGRGAYILQCVNVCRENQHPERLGPQAPGWATQENGKETQLWPIEWGVNMLQFCSVSNSLSRTTLSIKWEVNFSQNCVARLYCVVVMILHACICVWIVGHGYTTLSCVNIKLRNLTVNGAKTNIHFISLLASCQMFFTLLATMCFHSSLISPFSWIVWWFHLPVARIPFRGDKNCYF